MTPIDILIRSLFDPKGTDDAKKSFDKLGDSITQGIGIAIGQKLTNAVQALPQLFTQAAKAGVDFNATLEQQTVAFETLLGSADAAKERVDQLFTFAATTPFEFGEVVRADKVLQSLTQGALAGEKGLRLVGDAAAAAGVPFEEAAMWVGRLYSGLENGLPVGEATLRLSQMGLVTGQQVIELQKLAESGDAMGRAMEILDRTFSKTAGGMEKQSKTLNGQLSTLRDNLKQLAAENTKDIFEGTKTSVNALNDLLNSEKTKAALSTLLQLAKGQFTPASVIAAAAAAGEASVGDNSSAADIGMAIGAMAASDKLVTAATAPTQMQADQPLTDAQKKINDDANKAYLDSIKERMAEKTRLAYEQLEAENEIEEKFANNKAKREEELFKVREIYAAKFSAIEDAAEQSAYEKWLDDEEKKRAAHAETVQKQLTKDEDALRLQRESIALKRAELDADFRNPDYTKREARLKLIKDEIAALDALIKKLLVERELENDPATRQLLQQRIQGLQSDKTNLDVQRIGIESSANPFSFTEQFQQKWTEMMSQIGTTAQMAANAFEGAMMGAIGSVSGGITDLIMGTKSWSEALQSIYRGVMQSIIQEIVNMGVKWFVTHVFMQGIATGFHALMRLLGWETAIENNAQQATQTPVLATNAALSSVASWGGALVAVAALAALVAGFAGGFKEGGFTGAGDPNAPAGIVHRGEFVFTAPQTAALGRQNLAVLAGQATNGSFGGIAAAIAQQASGGGAAGAPQVDARVSIAPVMDGSMVEQWARSTAGRKVIIDIVSGAAIELGHNT